jgi:iron complex outermembrane receptor protein
VVVNRKVNTPGGPLDGYEVNLQAPFSFLPGFWSNFGVLANYTHVKSKITYITRVDNPEHAGQRAADAEGQLHRPVAERAQPHAVLRGQQVQRAGLGGAPFSYLLNVLGDVQGHDFTTVDGSTNVDFSMSYNITPQLRLSP